MSGLPGESGELLDESTVQFERLLPGPIERVWSYLVDSDKRSAWLCAGDMALEAGGAIEMHFHNAMLSGEDDIDPPKSDRDIAGPVSFEGRVLRCDPPRYLSYTWNFGGEHTVVSYVLEEAGNEVRLRLTHAQLASADEITSASAGWHTHLSILSAILNHARPPAFWKTHAAAVGHYRTRVRT